MIVKRRIVLNVRRLILVALLGSGSLLASQRGSMVGRTIDQEGRPVAGAMISVTSRQLGGPRVVRSDARGHFALHGLKPGAYNVSFTKDGLSGVERRGVIELGRFTWIDATLESVKEGALIVLALTDPAVVSPSIGANFHDDLADNLAIDRSFEGIGGFAPGVDHSSATADSGPRSISGGLLSDNLVLVDGADLGDARVQRVDVGSVDPSLIVGESLAETQVLGSVIPVEYGRFSGGVINAVTRSGGPESVASLRLDLRSPGWREETAFEGERGASRPRGPDEVISGTLSGGVGGDRLFYFLAAHDGDTREASLFAGSGGARTSRLEEGRVQAKLTTALGLRHALSVLVARNDVDFDGVASAGLPLDSGTKADSSARGDLLALDYYGTWPSQWQAEVGFSSARQHARLDPVVADLRGSPILTLETEPGSYAAPFFDPREAAEVNRRRVRGSLSHFFPSGRVGAHDLGVGFELFAESGSHFAGSGSSRFVLRTDYLQRADGRPLVDASERLAPAFVPGRSELLTFWAAPDARIEAESKALWGSDRWLLDDRWSLLLGLRYEDLQTRVPGGRATGARLLPRVGVVLDSRADGSLRFELGYAEYAGGTNLSALSRSVVERRSFVYNGPQGAGLDFSPGFDVANYLVGGTDVPSRRVVLENDLRSPLTKEFTVVVASQIGPLGYVEVSYTRRKTSDLIDDSTTFAKDPTTLTTAGGPLLVDTTFLHNSSTAERRFEALQLRGSLRLNRFWSLQAHWTHQLETEGNFDDRSSSLLGAVSPLDDYPEVLVAERNSPYGRLTGFREDRARAWGVYERNLGKIGAVMVSVIYRYDSAPFFSIASFAAPLSDVQLGRDPGYALLPTTQTVFYGPRGGRKLDRNEVFDLSLRYMLPIDSFEPWIKLEVRNLADTRAQVGAGRAVLPDLSGPVDENGIWTRFLPTTGFATPLRPEDFIRPREIRVSMGLRFGP